MISSLRQQRALGEMSYALLPGGRSGGETRLPPSLGGLWGCDARARKKNYVPQMTNRIGFLYESIRKSLTKKFG